MLLAVDVGNSNIVIGAIKDGKILFEARIATDLIRTSDQYAVEIKDILELYDAKGSDFEGCILSSVVPPLLNSLRTAIRKLTGKIPLTVGPEIRTDLKIAIDNPSQVGGDLLVGAVAALRHYQPPMAIIDMGTATTITVIDREGTFVGGCICPGVRISMEALNTRTAQLPGISLQAPDKVIGKNTIECMQSGLMHGAASMLDGLLSRIEEEAGHKLNVIMTGGISRFVMPLCRHEMTYDKDLLLKGLWVLYEMNR
ncbi:MAG: type III pantothenate kinase [Oscillospiraceae bacterium]|nr:type III pantothenate kinase [Oscillospiraceae bacterium]